MIEDVQKSLDDEGLLYLITLILFCHIITKKVMMLSITQSDGLS